MIHHRARTLDLAPLPLPFFGLGLRLLSSSLSRSISSSCSALAAARSAAASCARFCSSLIFGAADAAASAVDALRLSKAFLAALAAGAGGVLLACAWMSSRVGFVALAAHAVVPPAYLSVFFKQQAHHVEVAIVRRGMQRRCGVGHWSADLGAFVEQ